MKNIQLSGQAYDELLDWVETDPKLFEKSKRFLKKLVVTPLKEQENPSLWNTQCVAGGRSGLIPNIESFIKWWMVSFGLIAYEVITTTKMHPLSIFMFLTKIGLLSNVTIAQLL